jgi:hypothetical protein
LVVHLLKALDYGVANCDQANDPLGADNRSAENLGVQVVEVPVGLVKRRRLSSSAPYASIRRRGMRI